MPIHYWGDEWFKKNGDDLEAAMRFIQGYCRRWGRLGGYIKETYGTIRFTPRFHTHIYDLFWPGCGWGSGPIWPRRVDCKYYACVERNPLRDLIVRLQKRIYRSAYVKAAEKWPHLIGEILMWLRTP